MLKTSFLLATLYSQIFIRCHALSMTYWLLWKLGRLSSQFSPSGRIFLSAILVTVCSTAGTATSCPSSMFSTWRAFGLIRSLSPFQTLDRFFFLLNSHRCQLHPALWQETFHSSFEVCWQFPCHYANLWRHVWCFDAVYIIYLVGLCTHLRLPCVAYHRVSYHQTNVIQKLLTIMILFVHQISSDCCEICWMFHEILISLEIISQRARSSCQIEIETVYVLTGYCWTSTDSMNGSAKGSRITSSINFSPLWIHA